MTPETLPMAADWLRARARSTPLALALLIGEQRWSYQQLDELVNRWAGWLELLDLGAGPLGMLLPNTLEAVCLIHACARAGVVMVTLNTRLTAAELRQQLDATGCSLIVTDRDDAAAELGDGVTVQQPPDQGVLEQTPPFLKNKIRKEDAVQAIVFTSGTTGRPKAVPITFKQHFYSALGSAFHLGVDRNDLWLSSLPLYHVGGLAIIFRSCLYGTAVDLHARFDVEQVDAALADKPITLISLVPTMLGRLFDHGVTWPVSLRLVLLGGAATVPELVARAAEQGIQIAVSYGMTEAASQIATMVPPQVWQKPGSVGRPLLFGAVKIVGESGNAAAVNEYGDIWLAGPNIAAGYLDQPAANTERFVNGWFKTGDIGYTDDEGDLWLVQRRSDLIISGGENVYPAEVERVLRHHPAVAEVVVVGLQDPEWGQRVAALVVRRSETDLEAAELERFARQRLAGYKIPRQVLFVDTLPRTASGKVARRAAAEQLIDSSLRSE